MADHITVAEEAETLKLEVGCTNLQKTAPGQQDGAGGLAIQPDHLSLIPRIHIKIEGEN